MKTPLNLPFLPALGSVALGRWDIAVFKLPEEPEVRYIKRMVGMPDEVVRILRGDIWTSRQTGDAPFQRALRSLRHQDAMQILVNDDAHRRPGPRRRPSMGSLGASGRRDLGREHHRDRRVPDVRRGV